MVSYAFLEVALAKHGWHSCDIPGNIAQRNASTKTILIFFITFSVYLFFRSSYFLRYSCQVSHHTVLPLSLFYTPNASNRLIQLNLFKHRRPFIILITPGWPVYLI